jgi:WD40 repeat protein
VDHPIFFGRESETRKLLRLVTIYRGVLVYGDSGTGKSSLINAGLIPEAMSEGLSVERLRVQLRINAEFIVERLRASDHDPSGFLPSRLTSDNDLPRVVLSAAELADRIQGLSPGKPLVLVLDQFEEWVTQVDQSSQGEALHEAYQAQDRILETLVNMLRDHSLPVKLLFVFREDYLAKLSPLFRQCPDLANNYLRLTSPTLSALPKIIRGAFECSDPEHTHWSTQISSKLAESIRQQLESRGRNTINLSEIQVVCLRLWQSRDPERLFAQRQISGILEDFLATALSRLGSLEKAAVVLLSQLVTISGTRNVVSYDDLIGRAQREEHIPKTQLVNALNVLVEGTKLVSKELRNDVYFYEIVSEFLVPWILQKKIQLNESALRSNLLRRIGYSVLLFSLVSVAFGSWFYQRNSAAAQRHSLVIQLMQEKRELESKKTELEQNKQDLDRLLKATVSNSDDAFKQEAYRQLTQMQTKLDSIEKATAETRKLNIELASRLKEAETQNQDLSSRLKQFEIRTQELLSKIKQLEDAKKALTNNLSRGPDAPTTVVPESTVVPENVEDALAVRLTKEAQQTLERDSDLSVWLSLYAFKAAKSQPAREYAETMLRKAVWKAQALPVLEVAADKAHLLEFAFSPDGTNIVTVETGHPKAANIWDIDSGRHLSSITGHHGSVLAAVFSPDGRRLATGADDGIASFWDLQTGNQIKVIRAREEIDHIAFSADGQLVAFAGHNHDMQVANSVNRPRAAEDSPLVVGGGQGNVARLADPSEESADGYNANSVRSWDLNSSATKPLFLMTTVYGSVTEIQFSPDGTFLAVGTSNGGVILCHITRGSQETSATVKTEALKSKGLADIERIIFSHDGHKIAALDRRGAAEAWDIRSKPYHSLMLSHELMGKIKDIAFDASGRLLILDTYDAGKNLVVRDGQTGERVDTNDPSINARNTIIKFSTDAKLLAISDQQRKHLRIYALDADRLASLAERYVHRKLTTTECAQHLQQSTCPPLP